jgi:hypothetical protein
MFTSRVAECDFDRNDAIVAVGTGHFLSIQRFESFLLIFFILKCDESVASTSSSACLHDVRCAFETFKDLRKFCIIDTERQIRNKERRLGRNSKHNEMRSRIKLNKVILWTCVCVLKESMKKLYLSFVALNPRARRGRPPRPCQITITPSASHSSFKKST